MQINISVSNILNFRGGGKIVAINDGFFTSKTWSQNFSYNFTVSKYFLEI